jgi:release factor glutamine methyltransferase
MAIFVGELLGSCIERLRRCGIPDPEISARLIIQKHLKKTPVQMQLAYNESVAPELVIRVESDITRRIERYPLQYILGEVDFFNIKLKVDERALIPRPETEILVGEAIKASEKFPSPKILDIGTGSGNIAIALAANIQKALIRAVDISAKAIELARENAILNGVNDRIEFNESDCLDSACYQKLGIFDIVVSNPPYVDEREFNKLQPEIRLYEPQIALVPGGDVLKYYKAISAGLSSILRPGGFVIVEIGQGQEKTAADLFTADNPSLNIHVVDDLNSIPRVMVGELSD